MFSTFHLIHSSDEDMLIPSDTEEKKQCGDATVVINAVPTPPAMTVSSDDYFIQLLHKR